MVAKVIIGKSVKGALNYNEKKVASGQAVCIMANKFFAEPAELTFYDKLNRFQKYLDLRPSVGTNTLHIPISFAIGEHLGLEQLQAIASSYMQKLGFGDQPYVVYQHLDTAIQHLHVVTVSIDKEGKPISLHNIGLIRSELARKEVEKEFNLVKAEGHHQQMHSQRQPTLSSIVQRVISSFRFTSLEELNAALSLHHVIADLGKEDSRMFQKGGLIYSKIDSEGRRIGRPRKASSIPDKPTIKFLQKQFEANEKLRLPFKRPLRNAIDKALLSANCYTLDDLKRILSDQGIQTVFRKNATGFIYGLTIVDNNSRTIFKASDLGKGYSIKAIQDKLLLEKNKNSPVVLPLEKSNPLEKMKSAIKQGSTIPKKTVGGKQKDITPISSKSFLPVAQDDQSIVEHKPTSHSPLSVWEKEMEKVIDGLVSPEQGSNGSPETALGLRKRKRRKRKKNI